MTLETQEPTADLNDFQFVRQRDWTAAKIVAVYTLIGGLWILLSDRLVAVLVTDPALLNTVNTLKGWGYIGVTALLLYALIQTYTAALREREERLRLALMATDQGLYDVNLRTGETRTSPEYALLLGYDPADFHENEASWTGRLHPADRDRAVEAYHAYIRGDIPAYAVEYRQRTHSGEWKWIQSVGRIVERDPSGQPSRMLGTQTDISARKQAEYQRELAVDALRESEARLQGIISSAMDAIISVSDDQRILLFNAAAERMFRCPAAAALGLPLNSFIPQRYHTAHQQHIRRFGETGITSRSMGALTPLSAVRADGDEFPIEASISQVVVGGQKLFTVILRDITDRQRAEEEVRRLNQDLERTQALSEANERLRELDRLKSQFVSDVSHELRTPVTNLKLYIELLEVGKPEKLASYITILKEQSRRLTDLVESILDLSRLERDQTHLVLLPLDLNLLVEQVTTAHLPRAVSANIQLLFEPAPDLPFVRGAANQLTQVVTNLIANALNYTMAGQVSIITLHLNDQVCLQVRDTGIGIAPEDVPHLFERFYRGRNVSRSATPGTGLGLAIVKEIVDAHHGRIEVDSQVGIGTIFRIYLPVITDRAAEDAPS